MKKNFKRPLFHDFAVTIGLLFFTTGLTFLLFYFVSENPANIALFYIVGIISVARYTNGYFYGIFASFLSIILINCFFSYPYFRIDFTLQDYPFTFMCMLTLASITSITTTHLKQQTKILAFHEKQLMEAEKEKMRANLLRAVSHDLRTPLTSILGSISSIEAESGNSDPQEWQELIRNIHDDAVWLLNMVENLLSVTRIQTGTSRLNTSPEIVDEVVAESVTRIQKRFPDAEIDVTVPSEILMVSMDAMLIEQVLLNLLENAITHSESSKPVRLIVENHPRIVCFRVIDYGVGLQENQLEHIFDGTYSEGSSADIRKGMGIGLSICKTIVTAHKGSISAENHAEGAEFLFTLPKEEM
ncbi:ATP-binding protein [Lachnospiraceae bacterium KK002]